jgi:hypothetical protein
MELQHWLYYLDKRLARRMEPARISKCRAVPRFCELPFTRPMTVGTAVPDSCQVGQFYINSAVSAGANLYACTAQNVWSLEATNVSGNGVAWRHSWATSRQLFLKRNATTASCNARIRTTVHSFRNSATVTPWHVYHFT